MKRCLIFLVLASIAGAQNLLTFGLGKFHLPPPSGVPISDNFNEVSLNTGLWTFQAPAGGSESMTGTALQMNVPGAANHDPAFGGANNSVRVKQTLGGNINFIAIARFDSKPTQQYQFEGFLIEQDATNYLRFQFGSDGTLLQCNADTILGGVETDSIVSATVTGAGASIWLQIQVTSSTWTLLYSLDGSTYITVGTFTQALSSNALDIFGGNFNNTAANSPAFTVLVNDFSGAQNSGGGGGGGGGGGSLCPGSSTTRTSSGHITAVSGGCYENLHITTTSGDCVTLNNVSNVTFHNNEIGPCNSADGTGSNSGMGFNVSGGSNNRILDNYIHNEDPCIVNQACTNGAFDLGNNITCNNSTNLLVQGNILAYGESGIEGHTGCNGLSAVGNFCLNTINNLNAGGNRGACIQNLNLGYNTTVDHNYILETGTACTSGSIPTVNGIAAKYRACNGDLINFGQDPNIAHGQDDNINVTNNYVQGGNFSFGCGINYDGGAAEQIGGRLNTISGNLMLDTQQCPISIEGGFNYAITGNKILNRNTFGTVAFQTFNEYGPGCGNISFSSNYAYVSGASAQQVYSSSAFFGSCTNVTGAGNGNAGNVWDTANTNGPAFNAMQPIPTQLPIPAIPPLPFNCTVASPFTNNTSVTAC